MTKNQRHQSELFSLIPHLKTSKDAEKFLTDLLTPQELEAIAERWQVAKNLLEGKLSQREIVAKVGCALATVSRGNRMIQYGSGGFAMMWKRVK